LELRKAGASYREIARRLNVNVHTAHGDIGAELAAIRERTVEGAADLRQLELQRFDEMTAGLWPQIQAGSPPAVSAAIRVSERRSRLLGLDEPVLTKTELTGSLGVYAERLTAERELFLTLSIGEMEELAADSQALVDKLMAMANVNAATTPMLVGASPSPVVGVEEVLPGEAVEPTAVRTVGDQGSGAAAGTPSRDTP
jgi:hypothetical protein